MFFRGFILAYIILITNIFGLFSHMGLSNLSTPIGTLHFKDIGLIVIIFFTIIEVLMKGKLPIIKSNLGLPIALILILTIMQIIRSYFYRGEDLHYIMRLARPFMHYSFFFVLLYKINDTKLFNLILTSIVVIGFIVAVIGIAQVVFNISLGGSKILRTGYGFQRTYQPNVLFSLFGFYILMCTGSRDLRIKILSFAYYIVTICFVLVTYSRGLWFTFIISIAIYSLLIKTKRDLLLKYSAAFIFIIMVFFAFVPVMLSDYSRIFLSRAESGIKDFTYKEGTFSKRLEIMRHSYTYAKEENIIAGVGFIFGTDKWDDTILRTSTNLMRYNPFAWTGADNGCAYILFRHGVLGMLIYIFLYHRLFKKGLLFLKLRNRNVSIPQIHAILILAVISIMLSIISEPFTKPEMLIVLILSWYIFEYNNQQRFSSK